MTRIAPIAALIAAAATLIAAAPAPAEAAPAACAIVASRAIPSAQSYFDSLPARFVADAAARTEATIQWTLAGPCGGEWHAVVDHGALTVRAGAASNPDLTISMDAGDYVAMVNQEVNGRWLFVSGKGKVDGSVSLAMKLNSIFPLE